MTQNGAVELPAEWNIRAQPRTAVLFSEVFRLHDNPNHPENQQRLDRTVAYLESTGLLETRVRVPFAPAAGSDVTRIHHPRYVERLDRVASQGGGWLDQDTYVTPHSFDVGLQAAGAAVTAVNAVLDKSVESAFVLSRPPGHHATPDHGMGFCLFNNVAIAAAHGLSRGLEKIAIVDWDVHHGNGTQDAFYDRSDVLYISLHQYPFYPGSGSQSERGIDDGEGFTLNLPMPAGSGDSDYKKLFDELVVPALEEYAPDMLLVSAGFDAHRNDPLAEMQATEEGFAYMAASLRKVADRSCAGRIVAILEGGYDPTALSRSVAATLNRLDEHAV